MQAACWAVRDHRAPRGSSPVAYIYELFNEDLRPEGRCPRGTGACLTTGRRCYCLLGEGSGGFLAKAASKDFLRRVRRTEEGGSDASSCRRRWNWPCGPRGATARRDTARGGVATTANDVRSATASYAFDSLLPDGREDGGFVLLSGRGDGHHHRSE
ncbi:uncharacterized protein A4U43_C07F38040 [Asparagus officinalis]|uniref:Uncharacterized protein n=1 Tax=Asparagus officinalis TaxID=4686 RepID=A0A5P1EL67_ASPOF|nr:uncharacterized protein A4U43_C07F38040 [Asparagus officinalis]